MTVGQMNRAMPREEFTRWIAFYSVEGKLRELHRPKK